MKNRVAIFLFLLLPAVAFFYFFVQNNSERSIDTLQHITQLQEFKLMNLELNDIVIAMGSTTYGNFDAITQLSKKMRHDLKQLKNDISFCEKSYNLATQQLDQKLVLIDGIKRKAAIIRNSLGYLPTVTKSLIDSNISNELQILIIDAFKDSSYLLQTGDKNIRENLHKTLEKLNSYIKQNEVQNQEIILFYKHLMLVEREITAFKEKVQEALDVPLDETVQRMITVTEQVNREEKANDRLYEYVSLALVLLLSLVAYYFFFKNEKNREKLLDSAKYDSLTGAKSRFYLSKYIFADELNGKILVLFDVKNFSTINEAYGHDGGDQILVDFSAFIARIFKAETFRIDSDRFAILLENYEQESFEEKLKVLKQKIQDTSIYFDFYVLIYPLQGSNSFDGIFPDLEAGIYALKKTPNEPVLLYNPDNKFIAYHKALSKSALKLRENIERVLQEERFVPFYQPILNIASEKVEKYEVLMRVEEDGKYLPPFEYIVSAERFNLINEISKQMISKSFAFAAQNPEVEFSINLSTYDLENEKMVVFIKENARTYGINPAKITFEITETGIMLDMQANIQYLKSLKKCGFMIAIDDFGVGQSSLQYLKELPADIIKIDGSFIKNIDKNQKDREFVALINQIIKIDGKKSVAEFVENESILNTLRILRVDYAQGYFIGKPTDSLTVVK